MNRPARGARWVRAVLACAGAAWVGIAALAGPVPEPAPKAPQPGEGPRRPAAAGRTVGSFDFEEQAYNPEVVPRHWFRAQSAPPLRDRPGFPQWNRAAFDRTVAHSGTTSVKVPTVGGSAALQLTATTLPVFPGADYRVSAQVRTSALKHARAFVEATLLDARAEPIEGASFRTGPTLSPDAWTEVSVVVPGRFESAAYLRLELQLLQPAQFAGRSPLGQHAVWSEDLDGAAWFDDVAVLQLPRITLTTARPANIFAGQETPRFDADIRDLTGEHLTARMEIRDTDGAVVAVHERDLGQGGGAFSWAPPLTRLGWYEARLSVLVGDRPVGGTRCAALWLAAPAEADAPVGDRTGEGWFAIIADELHPDHYALMAPMLRTTRLHAATIPLQPELAEASAGSASIRAFRACLEELLEQGAWPSVAITGLGPSLAASLRMPADSPLGLLGQEESLWLPALERLFDLYGQRVSRWEIGRAGRPEVYADASLPARLAAFRHTLRRFVPGPRLTIAWAAGTPWPATRQTGSGGKPVQAYDALTLLWPAETPNEQIDAVAAMLRSADASATDVTVVLESRSSDRAAAVRSAMQQAILFWNALDPAATPPVRRGATRVGLVNPWTVEPGTRPALNPEPTLGALATLSRMLSSRRIVGEFNAGPGVRCLILAPASGAGSEVSGALAVWRERADGPDTVTGYFGAGPLELVDAFGNRTPMSPIDGAGRTRFAISTTPAFVEGADTELVRFLSALRVSPGFVPAVAAVHEHELVLFNPWPVNVSGQIQLSPPESLARRAWRFSPTAPIPFAIAPGQTARLPFSFSFSASEEAGQRSIAATISVSADRTYPPMRFNLPITIGLADLDVQVASALTPSASGPDVMITVTVKNTGASPRTMQLDLQAPGLASQQQPVSNLGGGETAVRRFVLRGAAAALAGKRVRVALYDIDGTERLNKYVQVP